MKEDDFRSGKLPGPSPLPRELKTEDVQACEETRIGQHGHSVPSFSIANLSACGKLMEGETFGQYRIERKLGQGGMGAVYLARHLRLNKLVAIKVLPNSLTSDPAIVERFDREMRAVGLLEHPHIVRAMDAGEVNGNHFLVMEYIEGADLQKLIQSKGPRKVIDACEIIRQAAVGLAYAHDRGLVHRDLKPANLLLTKQGKIKILDLGLARLQHDPDQHSEERQQLTAVGTYMGTADYMAPEQWEDSHNVDGRCDLYALGCTLHFLLTGRTPFGSSDKPSLTAKMLGHIQGVPPNLNMQRPDVPGELNALYQRLMAKSPADRPADATELESTLAVIIKSLKSTNSTAQFETSEDERSAADDLRQSKTEEKIPSGKQLKNDAVTVFGAAGVPPTKPSTKSGRNGPPSKRIALVAGGGLFATILCGVIVITITNRDGTETKIVAPEGARVKVEEAGISDGMMRPSSPNGLQKLKVAEPLPDQPLMELVSQVDWVPSSPRPTLGGLVPQPAQLAGINNWQMETCLPRITSGQVAFSPNGRQLSFSVWSGGVLVYDVETQQLVSRYQYFKSGHVGRAQNSKWSPDGKWFATCTYDGVRIWNADGNLVHFLKHQQHSPHDIAWRPDSQQFVTTDTYALSVKLWNLDGTLRQDLKGHTSWITLVRWSPDGRLIATGADDQTVRLWNAESGESVGILKCTEPPGAVEFSPSGESLAIGEKGLGENRIAIRIWKVADQTVKTEISNIGAWANSLHWSEDEKRIYAVTQDGFVIVFDSQNGRRLSHTPQVSPISGAISPDRKTIADTGFRLWEIQGDSLKQIWKFDLCKWFVPIHRSPRTASLELVDDQGALYRWAEDGSVQDVENISASFWKNLNFIDSLAQSPDRKHFSIRVRGGGYFIWNVDEQKPISLPRGSRSASWSSDSKRLFTYGEPEQNVIYTPEGSEIGTAQLEETQIQSAEWSPDSSRIAAACRDGSIRILLADGTVAEVFKFSEKPLEAVKWSSDGKTLVTGGRDRVLRLLSANGEVLFDVETDGEYINSIAFSPDDQRLVSLSHPDQLAVRDRSGKLLASAVSDCPLNRVGWSESGQSILATGNKFLECRDPNTLAIRWRAVHLPNGKFATFTSSGKLIHGDPEAIESGLVYFVEKPGGNEVAYSPKEFLQLVLTNQRAEKKQ